MEYYPVNKMYLNRFLVFKLKLKYQVTIDFKTKQGWHVAVLTI